MSSGGQAVYSRQFGGQFSGQLMDSAFGRRIEGWLNSTTSDQPAGIAVAKLVPVVSGPSGEFQLLASAADLIAGIAVLSFGRDPGSAAITFGGPDGAIEEGAVADLLCEGAIAVQTEQAMVRGDPVYVRVISDGGLNTQTGRFRKDNDSGRARLVKGAEVLADSATGANGNVAGIYFSRAVDNQPGDDIEIPFSHPALAATELVKVYNTRADRHMLVDGVDYDNPTGFAANGSNYWALAAKVGATVLAYVDTSVAPLPVDTYVALPLNATPGNLIVPPGTALQLAVSKTGAPGALPAGSGVIHAHYV
jgi:hypothetical protein